MVQFVNDHVTDVNEGVNSHADYRDEQIAKYLRVYRVSFLAIGFSYLRILRKPNPAIGKLNNKGLLKTVQGKQGPTL